MKQSEVTNKYLFPKEETGNGCPFVIFQMERTRIIDLQFRFFFFRKTSLSYTDNTSSSSIFYILLACRPIKALSDSIQGFINPEMSI